MEKKLIVYTNAESYIKFECLGVEKEIIERMIKEKRIKLNKGEKMRGYNVNTLFIDEIVQ